MNMINSSLFFFLKKHKKLLDINHFIKSGRLVKKCQALLSNMGSKRILFHFCSTPSVAPVHQRGRWCWNCRAPDWLVCISRLFFFPDLIRHPCNCYLPKAELGTLNFPAILCFRPVSPLFLSHKKWFLLLLNISIFIWVNLGKWNINMLCTSLILATSFCIWILFPSK